MRGLNDAFPPSYKKAELMSSAAWTLTVSSGPCEIVLMPKFEECHVHQNE